MEKLKQLMKHEVDIIPNWQILSWWGSHDLEDKKKLYECEVEDGSVLQLTLNRMEVTIKTENKNISLEVIKFKM